MKLFTLTFILLISAACSSSKPSESKINALEVTDKLVKGETTQAKVLEDFGTPDVVEKSPEGDVWAYSRYASESGSVAGGVSHYISSAALWNWTGMSLDGGKSSSSTKTASLILYFNAKKVLKTYTYRTEKY